MVFLLNNTYPAAFALFSLTSNVNNFPFGAIDLANEVESAPLPVPCILVIDQINQRKRVPDSITVHPGFTSR
jgi:hypothetical protein